MSARAGIVGALLAAVIAAPAAAAQDERRFVTLDEDVVLRAEPDPAAPPVGRLAARTPGGGWRVAAVLGTEVVDGERWVRVSDGPRRGWVAHLLTRRALPPLRLRAAVRVRLEREAGASRPSVVVADADTGAPLFAHDPYRPRTLASVTELFVTAAALDRLGPAIGPELGRILRPSDNRRAERLAARVGGTQAIRGFARTLGVSVGVRGGSGLDPGSRASAARIVRFLVAMRRQPAHLVWQRALPVAGRSGTLRDRMRGTAASGRCQARTGTLVHPYAVSTLAGYRTTAEGRRVAFAILHERVGQAVARAAQDRMLAALAG